MYKIVLAIILLLFVGGCGRTAYEAQSNSSSNSRGEMAFETVSKSVFVPGVALNSGHFSTVLRVLNKPYFGASLDPLMERNNYQLIENGIYKSESRIEVADKKTEQVASKILLLLDLSGSIVDQGCKSPDTPCMQLIDSTKRFVNRVLQDPSFEISIYYFNSKRHIMPLSSGVSFPIRNEPILTSAIEQIQTDYFIQNNLEGYSSTNLYGAVKEGGEKMCEWIDCKSDATGFEIGSVVVFTDGRDEAGIVKKSDMLKSLKKNLQYYTIGIGEEADNKTLIEISGKAHHFEASQEDIAIAFESAVEDILQNSTFYTINYCPATQEGSVKIKIRFSYQDSNYRLRVESKEDKISLDSKIDLRCDL